MLADSRSGAIVTVTAASTIAVPLSVVTFPRMISRCVVASAGGGGTGLCAASGGTAARRARTTIQAAGYVGLTDRDSQETRMVHHRRRRDRHSGSCYFLLNRDNAGRIAGGQMPALRAQNTPLGAVSANRWCRIDQRGQAHWRS